MTFGLQCTTCGAQVTAPPDATAKEVLDLIRGWYFTTETGWLCPEHAPTTP